MLILGQKEKIYNCDKVIVMKHWHLYHDIISAHYSKSFNHIFCNSKE
jgi:hypothetical protein